MKVFGLLVPLSAACLGLSWQVACADNALWWVDYITDSNGVYDLRGHEWYSQASSLPLGETLLLPLPFDGDNDPDLAVYRDGEALVFVVDDGDEMTKSSDIRKLPSAAYFVDRDNDGLVDRLVDYIDNDANGVPDEMDIRYFKNGRLKWAWFWEDYDGDGKMWDIRDYEYGSCWRTDMSGDNMFYANKYDDANDAWLPFGECPFAFFDIDRDGFSEEVIRVSACPLELDPGKDCDYANSLAWYWGPVLPEMKRMGNVNVRDSFNLDNSHPAGRPYTYRCGVTLEGRVPYASYVTSVYTNKLRRHPNAVVRIPWRVCQQAAHTYPAVKCGFSWEELDRSRQWEGVFWTWERRGIYNAGAIWWRWNMRREFNCSVTTQRWLYFSPVDKRLHLFGAQAGWLEAGGFADDVKLAEFRTFDTDGDGYFDRWEVDIDNDGMSDRVSTVKTAPPKGCRRIAWDYDVTRRWYVDRVVGKGFDAQRSLLGNLSRVVGRPCVYTTQWQLIEAALRHARNAQSRRYLTDLRVEYLYHELRHRVALASRILRTAPTRMSRMKALRRTNRGWEVASWWAAFSDAYGEGDIVRAIELLNECPLQARTGGYQ